MNNDTRSPFGTARFFNSSAKEDMEIDLETALIDVYDAVDLVRDNMQDFEETLSSYMYGSEIVSRPVRSLINNR